MKPYSWDSNATINDGVNYAAYFVGPELGLPEAEIGMASRYGAHPLVAGVTRKGLELLMEVEVLAGSADAVRAWFDYEDETPKVLVVTDENGSNARYWRAICSSMTQTESPYIFLVKLRVHGDVRLRSVAPTTAHWDVTASGQTTTVTNGVAGVNDDAYPVITVTPQDYTTGSNPYRRFIGVLWRAGQAATNYPVDITNAALDTRPANTNFDSATGDDVRVYVDGVAADFWLVNPNTTTTKIWANLAWLPAQKGTTTGALGTGAISTLTLNESIDGWPYSGLFAIDSEVFQYTGKVNSTKTLTGVTRARRGTSAASHSAAATAVWIQHEITLEYGAAGYTMGSGLDYRTIPMFALSSSNTVWTYADFAQAEFGNPASDLMPRAGSWLPGSNAATERYFNSQDSGISLGTFGVLGMKSVVATTTKTALSGTWTLTNPCGIASANFTNGYFYHGKYTQGWWLAQVRSFAAGWTNNYTIPNGTNATWTAWSRSTGTLPTGTTQLQLALSGYGSSTYPMYVEAGDVAVTLNSDNTPLTIIGAEETTYRIRPTVVNQTTGESLLIDAALNIGEGIEIDVDNGAVTLLSDNTAATNAATTVEKVRKFMLRLQPGANVLRYDETGVTDVDVDISFERRWRS